MSQSFPPAPAAAAATIPNNMVMAIVATVVSLGCCLPHGLIALIFAMQVNKKETAGDIDGATKAAKQAKMFAMISIIVAVVWIVVATIFGLFGLILGYVNG